MLVRMYLASQVAVSLAEQQFRKQDRRVSEGYLTFSQEKQ